MIYFEKLMPKNFITTYPKQIYKNIQKKAYEKNLCIISTEKIDKHSIQMKYDDEIVTIGQSCLRNSSVETKRLSAENCGHFCWKSKQRR